MIHSFSCKNFYSFAEKTSVDFTVNDNAPKNDSYFITDSSTRLSKIETIVGPNASGKTNLLKVLPFLKWLIVDSYNVNPSAEIPVKAFLFSSFQNKPIELSVDFEVDGDIYEYDFILNQQQILEEELKIKNKTNERVTAKTLFVRKWDNKLKKYNFNSKKFGIPKEFENLLIRNNASIISAAMRTTHEQSQKIGKFWEKVEFNVGEAGWIGDHLFIDKGLELLKTLDFFSENENEILKKEAEKLLSRFDLGFDAFDIKKEKKEGIFSINAQIIHSFNGQKASLPVAYESSGTKQLFILLKTILRVLHSGGIAVLDEFDVNLHPEIIFALFELFISPTINSKNAQILLSTHSHRILNELDKYQIILVEKNEKGASEAWRLDEMSGVRTDDNYYTKYISGAYGAIPKIY